MTTTVDHAYPTETSRATGPAVLRELVQRHRVCWEPWPEYLLVKGEKRHVGFSLELSGTHERGGEHPIPGCPHCRAVYAALQTIAVYILPREPGQAYCEIEPYQPAIHYSASRRNRPDVTLTIHIVHREGSARLADEPGERCLEEMKQRLRELGACERHWVATKERNS